MIKNIRQKWKQIFEYLSLIAEEYRLVFLLKLTIFLKERHGRVQRNHAGQELEKFLVTINPPSKKRPNIPKAKTNDYSLKENDRIIVLAYEDPRKLKDIKPLT